MLERAYTPSSPGRARWGPRAIWRRWPTWPWWSSAKARPSSDGRRLPGDEALAPAGLAPVLLEAKEGPVAGQRHPADDRGRLRWRSPRRCALAEVADITGVMSLETIKGSRRPFDPRIAAVRPHPGRWRRPQHLARLTAEFGHRRIAPRLPQGAGRLLVPLHAPGARRRAATACGSPARCWSGRWRRHRQPAGVRRRPGPGATSCRAATSTASRWRWRWTSRPSPWPSWRRSPSAGSSSA